MLRGALYHPEAPVTTDCGRVWVGNIEWATPPMLAYKRWWPGPLARYLQKGLLVW